jgi:hypothetical protein
MKQRCRLVTSGTKKAYYGSLVTSQGERRRPLNRKGCIYTQEKEISCIRTFEQQEVYENLSKIYLSSYTGCLEILP